MRFVIVRHGEAEYSNTDDDRKLTETGKKEADSIGRFLNELGIEPEYIIHSSKDRSYQTSLIISEILNRPVSLHLENNAGPDGDISDIIKILVNSKNCLILVSHIPLVNKISNYLMMDNCTTQLFNFDTGSVLILNRRLIPKYHNIRLYWEIEAFLKPINFGF